MWALFAVCLFWRALTLAGRVLGWLQVWEQYPEDIAQQLKAFCGLFNVNIQTFCWAPAARRFMLHMHSAGAEDDPAAQADHDAQTRDCVYLHFRLPSQNERPDGVGTSISGCYFQPLCLWQPAPLQSTHVFSRSVPLSHYSARAARIGARTRKRMLFGSTEVIAAGLYSHATCACAAALVRWARGCRIYHKASGSLAGRQQENRLSSPIRLFERCTL